MHKQSCVAVDTAPGLYDEWFPARGRREVLSAQGTTQPLGGPWEPWIPGKPRACGPAKPQDWVNVGFHFG